MALGKTRKLDTLDIVLNKTILLILSIVTGVASIVGYKIHFLLGAVMITIFLTVFCAFIGWSNIEKWFNNLNNNDWKQL